MEQCHLLDIEGKVNKTFRNHLILSLYLTEQMWITGKVGNRSLMPGHFRSLKFFGGGEKLSIV